MRRNVPPPPGSTDKSVYTRFIPREELSSFAAWQLGELTDASAPPPPAPAEPEPTDPAAVLAEQLKATREAGYHDGYRDGLAALETFQQQFAHQATLQVGALVRSIGEQLDAMQEEMADTVGLIALRLARHVVRSELQVRPQAVAAVAREAIEALLLSARHVTLRVHPDDEALVVEGAGEVLAARGARVVPDAGLQRGGCRIESSVGCVDASLAAMWRRAAATIGRSEPWLEPADPPAADDARHAGDAAA